jgi:hypothetical protein
MKGIYMKAFCELVKKGITSKYLNALYNKTHTGGGVKINDFDFNRTIQDGEEDNGDIHIILNNNHHCLFGIISHNTPNIILLENFSYLKNCNITKDLEKDTGTKRMMRSFIQYISENEPLVKTIELFDTSSFPCNDDIKILNYKTYLFKYGKGYYAHHFGFKLVSKDDEITYNTNLKIASTLIINKSKFVEYLATKPSIFQNESNNITKFLSLLHDGKLVSSFISTFRCPSQLCNIYRAYLDFIFKEYKLDDLNGTNYSANITDLIAFNKIKINKSSKLTKKHSLYEKSTSSKLSKRLRRATIS